MDLHVIGPLASPAERAAVDAVLGTGRVGWRGGERNPTAEGHVARGGHDARSRRDLLIPALHAVQSRIGWISQPALNYVCRRLTVPPAEAYGVATFYALFSTTPRPPIVAHVCDDIACRARRRRGRLRPTSSGRSGPRARRPPTAQRPGSGRRASACASGRRRRWSRSRGRSRGRSSPAPVDAAGVVAPAARRDRADASNGIGREQDKSATLATGVPQAGQPGLRLLARVGVVDPTSLDDYRAARRLPRARARPRDRAAAGHRRGRRGPGSSAAAARPSRPAASGRRSPRSRPSRTTSSATPTSRSPGTFKDRVLMEGDPFAVVESMAIEAFAVGADEGLPLHPRRVPARRGPARERDRRGARRPGSSATSTSSSGAAPAPTSAARRRRSSSRSRASAASRATSRRSRSRSACSASRPRSTTSRRSSTCC